MALIDDTIIGVIASHDRDGAVRELIRLVDGQRRPLEQARDEMVRRLRLRSDDYKATAALTVLNTTLAEIGWPAPLVWESR